MYDLHPLVPMVAKILGIELVRSGCWVHVWIPARLHMCSWWGINGFFLEVWWESRLGIRIVASEVASERAAATRE